MSTISIEEITIKVPPNTIIGERIIRDESTEDYGLRPTTQILHLKSSFYGYTKELVRVATEELKKVLHTTAGSSSLITDDSSLTTTKYLLRGAITEIHYLEDSSGISVIVNVQWELLDTKTQTVIFMPITQGSISHSNAPDLEVMLEAFRKATQALFGASVFLEKVIMKPEDE